MSGLIKRLTGLALVISGLVLLMLTIIGVFAIYAYYGIKNDFATRANRIVKPKIVAGTVVTTGCITDAKKTHSIRTRKVRLVWWVDVPTQKKIYVCEWRYGFPGFKKGDEVLLVLKAEKKDTSSEFRGYIISKQGNIMERASSVKEIRIEDDSGQLISK
jgi:hypothetical protein